MRFTACDFQWAVGRASMPLRTSAVTLLEKIAVDNGFDLERPRDGDWLAFGSTQSPLSIWLTASETSADVLVALSMPNVADALTGDGDLDAATPLPTGAISARRVPHLAAAQNLVRRAFQLSRTLPNELLHRFQKATAAIPRATEVERLVVQRVGQEIFRAGLLEYWQGRCAVTGLALVEILRASHIKSWAECASDAERLDVFNGLLLAPHLDAAFDRGFVTFADDGELIVSRVVSLDDRRTLGIDSPRRVRDLTVAHSGYLRWHRTRLFRGL